MKYIRINGGEKNEKSGTTWTEEELNEVYNLYKHIGGKGIHERNPQIHYLANRLQRSVRSTEAQLLMYRALSMGKNYSHKNMNKICEKIWEDNKILQNMVKNDFVMRLLDLQQDGKRAISAPSNWLNLDPFLEVETEIDRTIDLLQKQILKGNEENKIGQWHFIIGSPGNGKSAAIGKLCRRLINENSCKIVDEGDKPICQLDSTRVPYILKVYEQDKQFPSVLIVQDASAVREPFNEETDPAFDLIQTLKFAWEKGLSMVICTNRGVLEKAHSHYHINHELNKTEWFKVINKILSRNNHLTIQSSCQRLAVFKTLEISYCFLDNRSLLDEENIFGRLIEKATSASNWKCCEECRNKTMCPFKANCDWMENSAATSQLLSLLKRAEVLSGQVLVFREALSLISLLLAGCPVDYKELHPCEWVNQKVNNDDIFSLASRRIYMTLFASYCPFGLESSNSLREQQLKLFRELTINSEDSKYSKRIRNILNTNYPSTDVGVERILGENGILSQLDPLKEVLSNDFYNDWDSEYDNIIEIAKSPFLTSIEQEMLLTWKDLERRLEQSTSQLSSEGNWALKRWSSNFLLYFGILYNGIAVWERELDEYIKLLAIVRKIPAMRDINEKRAIRDFEQKLNDILNTENDSETLELSQSVKIKGLWVKENLRPTILENQSSGSVSLFLKFAGGEHAIISALIYLWLKRREGGHLDDRCFPKDLLIGVKDARIRAASKGKYAFENDNIELIIDTGSNDEYIIRRFDGEPEITRVTKN